MTWTPQQEAVFAAVGSSDQHLVVEARAGTGKTTTAIEALYHTQEGQRTVFVAFNKIIADELKTRVPSDVQAMTLHSFGLRSITRSDGRRQIDKYAFHKTLDAVSKTEKNAHWKIKIACCKIASSFKNSCVQFPERLALIEALDRIEVASSCGLLSAVSGPEAMIEQRTADYLKWIEITAEALERCIDDCRGPIDFDDMVWLPVARGTISDHFDQVFVDETQDLSPVQLAMVQDIAGKSGRIVAIGDRYQSIYAFRGADSTAIPRMIAALKANTTPLTNTFRCPQVVTAKARDYVSDFVAMPQNIEGEILIKSMTDLRAEAQPGDFVISRVNAPLINLCLRWLASGTAAKIRGRQIGEDLCKWIENTRAGDVATLARCIDSWLAAETERLNARGLKLEEAYDFAEALHALCEGLGSVQDVVARCRKLFDDDLNRGSIQLMSTHKAKGLEADRVWLLDSTYMRTFKGQAPDQQEKNLYYVAITRSKDKLFLVQGS